MKKILIATTNPGKFSEITHEYADLPFKFVSLKDIKLDRIGADEPYETTWENALAKARFFAEKSKLITIAEDTGLFINYLNGKPGVKAKSTASRDGLKRIIDLMKGVPAKERGAYFENNICLFDPSDNSFSLFPGRVDGFISTKISPSFRDGMHHDAIFYYPPARKMFSKMEIHEKNLVSHRGRALVKLRHYLTRQFTPRQMVVAVSLILKNRKLLLLKRRDYRPEFNNKWEFPGGGVEFTETIEQSLIRETKEETGYTVKILEIIPKLYSASRGENLGNYRVFLNLFICQIKSGQFGTSDSESTGSGWFNYNQILKMDLIPFNKKIIQENKILLKKYID